MAPKPLAAALNGVSYNGMSGSTGGDIGRAIQDMLAQGEADRKEKTKNALDQSLLGVKQTEVANQGKQYDYNKVKDERDFALRQSNTLNDNEQARVNHQDSLTTHADSQASLDNFRTAMVGLSGRRADQADRRLDLSRMRIVQQNERANLVEDEFGHKYMYNPMTHEGEAMGIDPGDSMLKPMSQMGKKWQSPFATTDAPAAAPGVAPTGAPEKPIQPGAATDPAKAHPDSTAAQPDVKPFMGAGARPLDSERQMNMLVTSIGPSVDRIDAMYNQNAHAPSAIQQGLANKAKEGGLIGGIANTALGGDKNTMVGNLGRALGVADPNYQSILTDLTKTYRAFVYVTTGKQLNEDEARDTARQYVIMAGEPDELVQKKVADIRNMTQAVRNGATRAHEWLKRYNESNGSASPVDNAAVSNSGTKRQWKLADGTIVDLP